MPNNLADKYFDYTFVPDLIFFAGWIYFDIVPKPQCLLSFINKHTKNYLV